MTRAIPGESAAACTVRWICLWRWVMRQIVRRSSAMAIHITLLLGLLAVSVHPAAALKPVPVTPDKERIELTMLGELYDGRGDNLQVETAPGPDGMAGRMGVRASNAGTNPSWIVVALSNPTDKPIERWLTAERYTVVGSGIVWPDLDARRIEAITPSIGFVPERIKSDRADIFRITLEPHQTITYVLELSSDRFARIYLWQPLAYEIKARDRQLFNGTMLGLVGLLAIFLTSVFAANHKAIFPVAALVAWCVLAYLCVDFGFWHKLFQLRPEDNAVYRAATEAAMAASLVMFLHTFLRLGLWHGVIRMLVSAWVVGQLALIAVAVIDPRLAATFARASFALIGGLGAIFTLFLAAQGQDRALSIIPTWLLFLVWIFGAAVTLTGRLSGDAVVSGLVAGLVLTVMLIGFTVTQFAFRGGMEPTFGSSPNELQMRALAVDGASAAVWEWSARRDEIKLGAIVEAALGLTAGELSGKVDDFLQHMHPADRERFRLSLWSVQERNGGTLESEFRLRHVDSTYRWFELQAATVPGGEARALRCVGLVRDITDGKRAVERLMHDAVHDSLTGLPNRELFLDRLSVAVARTATDEKARPAVIVIDIDKFKSANSSFGLVVGDSLLLTLARRLQRHLGPGDTLARVGGDQFAILQPEAQDAQNLASLAERLRRSLRSPIRVTEQDVVLTGSLGIAVWDGGAPGEYDLLKEAEVAMYRAKRGGTDRIEIFQPDMRTERDERVAIESDLRKAIEKGQLKVLYQPIIALGTEELAGFEALVRWQHPKHGLMSPDAFIPVAEESDLIVKLGSFVLTRAVQDAARWQKELPRPDAPLFVSVNVSSRQLFRQDLVQEIRHILGRAIVPKGALKLEITESLVMENPEQASEMLSWLRAAGADLALDDFGTGYSSLAYLSRFPFDTIKIDRALVHGASNGAESGAIVRSIVALAHELGKKVVAEGVETGEDVGLLRGLGCEYAQGFYYGGAMGEREVLALLRDVRKTERRLQRRGFFRPLGRKAEPGAGGAPPLPGTEAAATRADTRAGPAASRPAAAPEAQSAISARSESAPPTAAPRGERSGLRFTLGRKSEAAQAAKTGPAKSRKAPPKPANPKSSATVPTSGRPSGSAQPPEQRTARTPPLDGSRTASDQRPQAGASSFAAPQPYAGTQVPGERPNGGATSASSGYPAAPPAAQFQEKSPPATYGNQTSPPATYGNQTSPPATRAPAMAPDGRHGPEAWTREAAPPSYGQQPAPPAQGPQMGPQVAPSGVNAPNGSAPEVPRRETAPPSQPAREPAPAASMADALGPLAAALAAVEAAARFAPLEPERGFDPSPQVAATLAPSPLSQPNPISSGEFRADQFTADGSGHAAPYPVQRAAAQVGAGAPQAPEPATRGPDPVAQPPSVDHTRWRPEPPVAPVAPLRSPEVDFSTLPPSIAASLARLAGMPLPQPPQPDPAAQANTSGPEPDDAAPTLQPRIVKAGE